MYLTGERMMETQASGSPMWLPLLWETEDARLVTLVLGLRLLSQSGPVTQQAWWALQLKKTQTTHGLHLEKQ